MIIGHSDPLRCIFGEFSFIPLRYQLVKKPYYLTSINISISSNEQTFIDLNGTAWTLWNFNLTGLSDRIYEMCGHSDHILLKCSVQ